MAEAPVPHQHRGQTRHNRELDHQGRQQNLFDRKGLFGRHPLGIDLIGQVN
jgi:hypothetical protein